MALRLRTGVSTAELDEGTALLDEQRGLYWNLNPTAAAVLRVLLRGGTDDEAAGALAGEYAVDLESALRDVRELVDELCSAGLVERTAGPPEAAP